MFLIFMCEDSGFLIVNPSPICYNEFARHARQFPEGVQNGSSESISHRNHSERKKGYYESHSSVGPPCQSWNWVLKNDFHFWEQNIANDLRTKKGSWDRVTTCGTRIATVLVQWCMLPSEKINNNEMVENKTKPKNCIVDTTIIVATLLH